MRFWLLIPWLALMAACSMDGPSRENPTEVRGIVYADPTGKVLQRYGIAGQLDIRFEYAGWLWAITPAQAVYTWNPASGLRKQFSVVDSASGMKIEELCMDSLHRTWVVLSHPDRLLLIDGKGDTSTPTIPGLRQGSYRVVVDTRGWTWVASLSQRKVALSKDNVTWELVYPMDSTVSSADSLAGFGVTSEGSLVWSYTPEGTLWFTADASYWMPTLPWDSASGPPPAIAQLEHDKHGNYWATSATQVRRIKGEGLAPLKRWTPQPAPDTIANMALDSAGDLVVLSRTQLGTCAPEACHWGPFPFALSAPTHLYGAHDGLLHVTTSRGPFHESGITWKRDPGTGLPIPSAPQRLALDSAGQLYAFSAGTISVLAGDTWTSFDADSGNLAVPAPGATALDSAGQLWIASHGALYRKDDSAWTRVEFPAGPLEVAYFRFDSANLLWILDRQGNWTLRATPVATPTSFGRRSSADPLLTLPQSKVDEVVASFPFERVASFRLAPSGALWACGTERGFARQDGNSWTIVAPDTTRLGAVFSCGSEDDWTFARNGNLWYAGNVSSRTSDAWQVTPSLTRYDGSQWTFWDLRTLGLEPTAFAVQGVDSIWIAARDQLVLFKP